MAKRHVMMIALGAALLAPICGAKAEILTLGFRAAELYSQSSGGAVTGTGAVVGGGIRMAGPHDFDKIELVGPGGSPTSMITGPAFFDPSGAYVFTGIFANFASLADLNAGYPFGRYEYRASNSVTGATETAAVLYDANHLSSAIPGLTAANYDAIQGMKASESSIFEFNSFTADGSWPFGPAYPFDVDPATQFIVTRLDGTPVYESAVLPSSTTSIVLAANVLDPSTSYNYLLIQDNIRYAPSPDNGGVGPGTGVYFTRLTTGTFVTAAEDQVTHTLVDFQGGTVDDPMALPVAGQIGEVTGQIGGAFAESYYLIYWQGGYFAATMSLAGAKDSATFQFRLYDSFGALLEDILLDQSNNFTATMTRTLSKGQYRVGILANDPLDPAYTLSFLTPVTGSVPEPASWALMIAGFGLAGAMLRGRRGGMRCATI